ncbi:MAG: sodium-independent anion transporter [Herbinix sp.]|nr:sodium-independent anion transporter [Herbinix sp.]
MEKLKPKLFSVMKTYSRQQFGKDVIAGIIVAIIALPLSIALALASGVTPERGLYTAIVAGFVISFLGGSRVQISGPTAAFASIVAGIVARNGMEGLAVATIMAGIMLIIMGLLRFGTLLRFVPYTITTGFTLGIAVTIFIGQIKDFLGLTFKSAPIETMEKLLACVKSISSINFSALLIGTIALLILIIWPKITTKVPGSLVAILVTALIVKLFDMEINTIGSLYEISSKLPTFHFPNINLTMINRLVPDAISIAILAGVESLLSCVVADGMIGSRHRRTPISGMVHSVTLLLILVVCMPYASLIPMPTIAAILFMVAYHMSEWKGFVELIKKSPKSDIMVLLVTFLLTVLFDLVVAIEIGLLMATILFVKRMSDVTDVQRWREDIPDGLDDEGNEAELKPIPKHTVVYEINGPMFFGAADKFLKISIADPQIHNVILRMRSVTAMDINALNALQKVLKSCQKKNVTLILSHVQDQPYRMMQKAGFDKEVGLENFCANIDKALERAKQIG